MAVGRAIPGHPVEEPQTWVGERPAPEAGGGRTSRRKVPSAIGPFGSLLGDSAGIIALRESATRLLQHSSDRGRLPSQPVDVWIVTASNEDSPCA